jgi:V/A-type H+-transporting ATPase subunit F
VADFFFIGEEELLVAFRLVGVAGRAVLGRDEALEAFLEITGQKRPADSGYRGSPAPETGLGAKVLILSSEVARALETEARAWQFRGDYPLIVEVPSPGTAPEEGASLLKAIREAVGISI